MALDFSASTHKVDHGSGASVDDLTTTTRLFWVYVDAANNDGRFYQKGYAGAHGMFNYMAFNTSSQLFCEWQRATSNLLVVANQANFAAFGTGKWIFVAATLDTATAANCRLLVGDLTTLAAEPSSYASQTIGSGAVSSDAAAALIIGNRENGGVNLDGRIAFVGIWNRVMSNAEIQSQQFRPHVSNGCREFSWYGFNGTGTQPDWSGNGNSGTVTGATVADHVPLGPAWWQGPDWVRYVVAAAPGAAEVVVPRRALMGVGR